MYIEQSLSIPPPPPLQSQLSRPSTANPPVQGDPAARTFGLFFLATLALMTIGVGVGIGVGNLAHYRYFSPVNQTSLSSSLVFNETFRDIPTETTTRQSFPLNERLEEIPTETTTRQSVSLNERLEKTDSPRKTRQYWLSIRSSQNNNHNRP